VIVIGIVIYAMATGLATRLVREFPHLIKAEVVKTPPPTHRKPPPPPKPELETPKIPTVPPPQIRLRVPPAPHAVKVVKQKIAPTPPKPLPKRPPRPPMPPPRPVAPVAPPAPTPARGIAATHTIPPYPPMARRLGYQGSVLLDIVIGADGRVTRASVIGSSGHSRLDEAARTWVVGHWRYKPATQNGKLVTSRERVKVVFNLSQAR
jgi:periplasmic protein TonB